MIFRRAGYAALSVLVLVAPAIAALALRTAPATGEASFGVAAPVHHTVVLQAGNNRIEVRLMPNRVNVTNWAWVRVSGPSPAARLRLTFTSLEMRMPPLTAVLSQTAPGRYAGRCPTLNMDGRWLIRVAPFGVSTVDRVR
jgi:hypothetical protein